MSLKHLSDVTIQTEDWSGPLPLLVQLLRFYKVEPDTFFLKDMITEAVQRVFPNFPQELSKESDFLLGICTLIYLKSRWLAIRESLQSKGESLSHSDADDVLPQNYLSLAEIQHCSQFLLERKIEHPSILAPKELFRPKIPSVPKSIKFSSEFLLASIEKIETRFKESTHFFTISRRKKWNAKEKIQLLKKILQEKKEFLFSEILEEPQDKIERIVGFFCILILFYKKEITLLQQNPFSLIVIKMF